VAESDRVRLSVGVTAFAQEQSRCERWRRRSLFGQSEHL
jgi:hypothetical protein